MTGDRIVSSRFPYLPLHLSIHGQEIALEALLDTGFDGAIVVPVGLVSGAQPPDMQLR